MINTKQETIKDIIHYLKDNRIKWDVDGNNFTTLIDNLSIFFHKYNIYLMKFCPEHNNYHDKYSFYLINNYGKPNDLYIWEKDDKMYNKIFQQKHNNFFKKLETTNLFTGFIHVGETSITIKCEDVVVNRTILTDNDLFRVKAVDFISVDNFRYYYFDSSSFLKEERRLFMGVYDTALKYFISFINKPLVKEYLIGDK